MTAQAQEVNRAQASNLPAAGQEGSEPVPVVMLAISSLSVSDSPRFSGESEEHVHVLAEAQVQLPPIIVHRATMQVIDGAHRLRAAKLRGDQEIAARFFSGNAADAFVLAVKSNIKHGLPLSLAERMAAAERIIQSHPQWSDRMIASVTGLASRTIADVRARQTGDAVQVTARIGQDGRIRPVDGARGRVLASQILSGNPDLSLRQVAHAAGISPETVRDVRNRLRRGEDPVPSRYDRKRTGPSTQPAIPAPRPEPPEQLSRKAERQAQPGRPRLVSSAHPGTGRTPAGGATEVIERLQADPALRLTETGRMLLRLLHAHLVETDKWDRIVENVPAHCGGIIAQLARECAQLWEEFADQVERNVMNVS
jgi:ParB-like chromosome segregation protein Spo0J